jgi:hypothetical protein
LILIDFNLIAAQELKTTLFIAVLLIASSGYAQEQAEFPYNNSFCFNVRDPLNHSYNIMYERAYVKRSTAVFSGGYYYSKEKYDWEERSTTGFLAELHDRIYFYSKQSEVNEKKWDRFFIGPCLFYQNFNEVIEGKYSNSDYTFSSFGGALLMGYNLTFHHFSFEVYLGGGLKLCTDDSNVLSRNWYDGNFWEPGYQGPIAKGGINIGIAF